MTPWLRRLLYLFVFAVWLLVMAFPLFAVLLAARGEVQFGRQPQQQHVRVFLIQERNLEGIGVEWVRPLRQQANCSQTHLRYIMWEGEGQNASYCQCVDNRVAALPIDATTCPTP